MLMPSLKEHIYRSHSKTTDAQHSLMHILFLIVRSKASYSVNDLQCGMKVFYKLLKEFFTINLEVNILSSNLYHNTYNIIYS